MNSTYRVFGVRTGLITPGESIADRFLAALPASGCGPLQEGDICVFAESAVATSEGRIICLEQVVPSDLATGLARRYDLDPRVAEVVVCESDEIVGGIPGFLLSMKNGTLLPNAGVDASNAPPGYVVPLPANPDASAAGIRDVIQAKAGVRVGVLVIDSRTHPMRCGCSGVAIGAAGIPSVLDDRGRTDLFGRRLEVTRRAVADDLASAAELVMGEADEGIPAAVIRGVGLPLTAQVGIEGIGADECLFMGIMARRRKQEE
ncbi:MAG: coenzyme F420-0:L-glutamate ligase [Methanoregulaceae archaeon]|nr:coenzyme F420-0:L-glutamate ligase [Methanoregulaceae archaeon]